ncbi:putative RuvC-like Holliday junction resolvase (plasmid) [Crocosphaera subtropica ATCC 51142]|uniref:RuvC-like Holliday junction resolvase n=2 Tax=Crocosphaera TaxID=263510 RepID=B1X361_CROS5|nr:putative RuvC-like Holliday junction resolvase [Crocosphaera subtropica ATCC 51142]
MYTPIMPNYHPLPHPHRTQWHHLPTKAIRVPECFVEEIKAYAISLDQSAEKPSTSHPPRWLGIKPSISQLGWAILEGETTEDPQMVDFGLISTNSDDPLPCRLAEIEADLQEIIKDYQPTQIAIEKTFINPEFPSTAKLLQVLGVLNLVAYRHGCLPLMVNPATWKSNLDNPKAEREDIADILEQMFYLNPLKRDAQVDAIAIAYSGWCGLGQHL